VVQRAEKLTAASLEDWFWNNPEKKSLSVEFISPEPGSHKAKPFSKDVKKYFRS
jgi:hypothetical protein